MRKFMSESEILPNLFFIQRGFLNGNHFVYRSDNPILIDTAYKADFDETMRRITDLEADVAQTSLIINTHCHCDHIGGNRIIQDLSGCRIAMHEIGKHFINSRDDWSTWWRYYIQEGAFFDCEVGLKDGDNIKVGPHEFEIIYTPGHASDGIVMYNRDARLLISSDTLWEYDMAVMTTRVEGSRALFCMLDSIEKISGLAVDVIYPGHGGPFNDYETALERARARLLRFISDPSNVGFDLIKKIIVYTLMMKKGFADRTFFNYLMSTPWYVETVDLYFSRDYENIYKTVMTELMEKQVLFKQDELILTTVNP